jgi:hypothetical protein
MGDGGEQPMGWKLIRIFAPLSPKQDSPLGILSIEE